jgi:hypothetical protein
MANIFGRGSSGFGGAFTSAKAQMHLSNVGGSDASGLSGLLINQLQASYNQPVNRIYELGTDLAYFVVGRPEGTGQIGSVFGPKASAKVAYTTLADPCNKTNLEFRFDGGAACGSEGTGINDNGFLRKLTACTLNSLGFQVAAQDMLINENIGIVFASMDDDSPEYPANFIGPRQ